MHIYVCMCVCVWVPCCTKYSMTSIRDNDIAKPGSEIDYGSLYFFVAAFASSIFFSLFLCELYLFYKSTFYLRIRTGIFRSHILRSSAHSMLPFSFLFFYSLHPMHLSIYLIHIPLFPSIRTECVSIIFLLGLRFDNDSFECASAAMLFREQGKWRM